jgi:hypothetical protein
MHERPRPFYREWRLRPEAPGDVFYTRGECRLPLLHEGGLRRLTRLTHRRLRPLDVSALAVCYGPGHYEFWAFAPESERPELVGTSFTEDWLAECGLQQGVNAAGERAWRRARGGQVVELVQLGWVDVLIGLRRDFVARVPRWRVRTGEQWRIVTGPEEWPETLHFLGTTSSAAGI